MTFVLILLIGGFAVAAATALVRGLMAFASDADRLRNEGAGSQETFGLKQNRMMAQRVLFQAIAIVLVALIGMLASQS